MVRLHCSQGMDAVVPGGRRKARKRPSSALVQDEDDQDDDEEDDKDSGDEKESGDEQGDDSPSEEEDEQGEDSPEDEEGTEDEQGEDSPTEKAEAADDEDADEDDHEIEGNEESEGEEDEEEEEEPAGEEEADEEEKEEASKPTKTTKRSVAAKDVGKPQYRQHYDVEWGQCFRIPIGGKAKDKEWSLEVKISDGGPLAHPLAVYRSGDLIEIPQLTNEEYELEEKIRLETKKIKWERHRPSDGLRLWIAWRKDRGAIHILFIQDDNAPKKYKQLVQMPVKAFGLNDSQDRAWPIHRPCSV